MNYPKEEWQLGGHGCIHAQRAIGERVLDIVQSHKEYLDVLRFITDHVFVIYTSFCKQDASARDLFPIPERRD